MDQIILGSEPVWGCQITSTFSKTFCRFVMIKIVLHAYFYYFLFILAVVYAENFRGGPSFVTIVWRHKSTLGEVPKARRF